MQQKGKTPRYVAGQNENQSRDFQKNVEALKAAIEGGEVVSIKAAKDFLTGRLDA